MADRIFLVTDGDKSPVSNVLDVPFTRPRARDAVLDARMEAPALALAPPAEQEFQGLRPKPDRRRTLVPMPPDLDRRRA